jgi:RHS repeat-associated protein
VQGREVLETNNIASVLNVRDEFGYVSNEIITVGLESMALTRLYDDEGRELRLASSLYVGYDASGRYSILSNNEAIVQYAYNSDGSEAGYTISLSNGIVLARNVYRDSEHPERIAAISNCVNGALVENFDYTYDLLGRPVVRNCDTFDYNPRSEVVFSRRGVANADDGYAYDDIGNLLVSCVGANTNSYSANNLNQYTSILHVSAPSSEDYLFYDLDGNLTNDSVFAYSYDAQNRLVSVLSNDVALLVNEYDSKSRRVRKITQEATTTFFYDDWNLIEERIARTNGTTSTIKYYWGKDLSGTLQGTGGVGGLLYLTISNSNLPLQLYIPCYDNIGNVTRYLDANGNAVAQYTYNAFGNIISKSGPLADFFRHRFSTKYYDAETGLYYYGYRFYHSELMRWLNRDPLGEDGGINLYTFCENDPVNKFDPNGCIPLDTVWDIANIIYDICVGDEVALAADIAALLVPYVPAGTTKLVKAARLSKVEKICPGAKRLEVTYEYLPTAQYKYKHTLSHARGNSWIEGTMNGSVKFNPGWGDSEIKGLIEEAFKQAKLQGKIKPSQLDGFVYDTRRTIGAANGKLTTKIKIHINSDGKNLHAFPWFN